jgi:acetylornithine deacetylase
MLSLPSGHLHDSLSQTLRKLAFDPLHPELMSNALLELIAIPSSSGQERFAIDSLATAVARLGLNVERLPVDDARDNLLITFGSPRVILTSHIDTVEPNARQINGIYDSAIYGRGSCDAKGQIVAMLSSCLKLRDEGITDFGLLIVVGEEDDGAGAKAAVSALANRGIEYLINGEPTSNKLVSLSRGCIDIDVTFSSSTQRGQTTRVDANTQAVLFLEQVLRAPLPTDPLLGQANINVGVIQGGQGRSVPSSKCTVGLCARCVTPTSDVLELIRSYAPAAEIKVGYRCEPCELMTLPGFDTDVALFGSDVGTFRSLGCKLLMMGPGSIGNAHKYDEHVTISELKSAAVLYSQIVPKLLSR